jgi:ribosomal subunit interface protein
MEHPLQVTFRGLEPTDALREAVEKRARELERFYDKIESCRVVVDGTHKRHRQGNLYQVRIRLTVPGDELVVSRDAPQHAQHEDLYLAINDSFKEAQRRLEDHVRKRRGKVKRRVRPPLGRVLRINEEDGYGFLASEDGREIYFHRSSVLDGAFHKLRVGTEVRFAEEAGEKGPQASSVSLTGGRGRRPATAASPRAQSKEGPARVRKV